MQTLMNKLLKIKFIKFSIVGVINTLVGTVIMFGLYNLFNFSYFFSSFMNYFVGSVISYILNKNYTFEFKENSRLLIVKFTINIIACYAIAYGLAKPIIGILLINSSIVIQDNVAMFVGMILFIVLNYFGQKNFVFKNK